MTSYIGKRVKPKHFFLTNFLIMLGLIEHLGIIVQFALTFVFSTYVMAVATGIIWGIYLTTLIAFNIIWFFKVIRNDQRFKLYR